MYHEIEELILSTNGIQVRYSLAYNNGPDVGVRGAINGKAGNDMVLIGDNAWLIAGDVIDAKSYERLCSVWEIHARKEMPESIMVNLRAQAIVCGKIVQVDLGSRKVSAIIKNDDESGNIVLA